MSLRDRKAAKTRELIASAANRLFLEKGYKATSLEDIAAATEVSVSTIKRYFESKEMVALAAYVESLQRFRYELSHRAEGVDALTFWRSWVLQYALSRSTVDDWRAAQQLVAEFPPLAKAHLHITSGYETTLAKAFAAEAGVDPQTDVYGQLLAAMLVAGNVAAIRRWIAGGGTDDLATSCLTVVDFATKRFPSRDQADITQKRP